jgi:hypothetical protein
MKYMEFNEIFFFNVLKKVKFNNGKRKCVRGKSGNTKNKIIESRSR